MYMCLHYLSPTFVVKSKKERKYCYDYLSASETLDQFNTNFAINMLIDCQNVHSCITDLKFRNVLVTLCNLSFLLAEPFYWTILFDKYRTPLFTILCTAVCNLQRICFKRVRSLYSYVIICIYQTQTVI